MQQPHGHTLKAFDQDLAELRALIVTWAPSPKRRSRKRCAALSSATRRRAAARRSRRTARRARSRGRAPGRRADRAPRADGRRPARCHRRAQDRRRRRAHRRLCQEYRPPGPRLPKKRRDRAAVAPPGDGRDRDGMVHDVLIAFVERDPEMARAVCKRDDALDDFYESIFRTLLTYMMEDPQNIGAVDDLAVRRQEPRTDRRPCDQHRRDGLFRRDGRPPGGAGELSWSQNCSLPRNSAVPLPPSGSMKSDDGGYLQSITMYDGDQNGT